MIVCKHCKKEIVRKDSSWIHKEAGMENCSFVKYKAEPQKYCKSCNEPQYDKDICDCGYGYEIRE
jgi:hypothetical protein